MFWLKSGFPGLEYNAIPKVIATSSLGSVADGCSHRIFINSINGDLRFGTGGSGNIFGLLFDESEQSYSFSFGAGCQFTAVLGSSFPRTTPRFQEIIPANSTGWMKIWSTAVGTFGVLFTRNPETSTNPNAYNGARNFHKLTLGGDSFVIPVFPPTC